MGTAIISDCGKYRYRLTRGTGRLLPVVMLNPSTADASVDDPTIKRLLGFAKRGVEVGMGYRGAGTKVAYDGIDVVNLYGLRATDPRELLSAEDPYGAGNDVQLRSFCRDYPRRPLTVAWGVNAKKEAVIRFLQIAALYAELRYPLACFGTNADGSPKHPLYLPYSAPLVPYIGWTP